MVVAGRNTRTQPPLPRVRRGVTLHKDPAVGPRSKVSRDQDAIVIVKIYAWAWAAGGGEGHASPPRNFIHGIDIVDGGLFSVALLPSAIFRSFFHWSP